MDSTGNAFWGILGGFALGAAAGAVTAILLAPRSGAETRTRLKAMPHAFKEAYSQARQAGVDAFNQNYATEGRAHAHQQRH